MSSQQIDAHHKVYHQLAYSYDNLKRQITVQDPGRHRHDGA